jgi:hypothetical protein
MARIERFEDMLSWQKARSLNRLVYAASDNATEVSRLISGFMASLRRSELRPGF